MNAPVFGIILPTSEIGEEPQTLRRFAELAEEVGLKYLVVFDHVVGADTTHRPDWTGPYTMHDAFHEPIVTLAYLAGVCSLELMTGILILPQRQATLVAKQAAELALVSGGRFILGVGTGWNELEYRALNVDFADRAQRYEEQIEVMRLLWSRPSVTYRGKYHDLDAVGLLPRPAAGDVPVWIGAGPVGRSIDRVGRLGDGWICRHRPGPDVAAGRKRLERAAYTAGRDPAAIAFQGMIQWGRTSSTVVETRDEIERWLEIGATRISFSGARSGRTPDEHLDYVAGLGALIAPFR